jgi:glutamyl-tRNA reductase
MIGALGINHKSASQDIRGLFAFAKEEVLPFAELVQLKTEITEIVVLSTCHRTEIFYYHGKSCNKKLSNLLINLLHEFKQVTINCEDSFYHHLGIDAVKHLFEVTSGMDSVVIGEDQIVNQVKEAYLHCTEAALTDAVLMRLFQKCFETSKRVRSETAMQQGATSINYVAADLCSKIYSDLSDKSVLFVGSGETGSQALQNMVKRGVTKTFITNRTPSKAQVLAEEYGGKAVAFEEFHDYIPQCDIVIVATSAQDHLIRKADVEASLAERNYNSQVYIDLSVPRNIEKLGEEVKNVQLFGVDDLQDIVDSNTVKRRHSIKHARIIIDEMAEEYMIWFESLTLRPIIKAISMNMRKLREDEMAVYKNSEDELKFKIIDEYTNRITQKYIGLLIKNLKDVSKNNPSSHSLNVINDLFMFDKGNNK